MRWRKGRRSANIEDRRGQAVTRRVRRVGRRGGIRGGAVGIIIAIIAIFMGADPQMVLGLLTGGSVQSTPSVQTRPHRPSAAENELADFTSAVLADTEDTWHPLFQQEGLRYQEPRLVLFNEAVQSGCGPAQSAMGPFYCPADKKVYIDLSFYRDLRARHNAPGDFAQAYVIAHEVGHHVQTLLGISAKVHQAKRRVSQTEANQLSVRQELQADCFSGLWAHHANKVRNRLEQGDLEEALQAANQIGDDTLQRKARGRVVPESFTHGSSEQRKRWFKIGFQQGTLAACDTFSASRL